MFQNNTNNKEGEALDTSNYDIGRIAEKKELVETILKLTIETQETHFTAPGQYSIIRIPDTDIEGPYTVCEYDGKRFTIVFRTTEEVSCKLATLELGDKVEIKTGLGNGYDVESIPDGAVLLADTTGIPQMLGLLRELLMRGKDCRLVLGYSSSSKMFMVDTFRNFCNNIEILTADGSNGREGHAYDGIRNADYVCAAGSVEMFGNLGKKAKAGQFNIDGMNVSKW